MGNTGGAEADARVKELKQALENAVAQQQLALEKVKQEEEERRTMHENNLAIKLKAIQDQVVFNDKEAAEKAKHDERERNTKLHDIEQTLKREKQKAETKRLEEEKKAKKAEKDRAEERAMLTKKLNETRDRATEDREKNSKELKKLLQIQTETANEEKRERQQAEKERKEQINMLNKRYKTQQLIAAKEKDEAAKERKVEQGKMQAMLQQEHANATRHRQRMFSEQRKREAVHKQDVERFQEELQAEQKRASIDRKKHQATVQRYNKWAVQEREKAAEDRAVAERERKEAEKVKLTKESITNRRERVNKLKPGDSATFSDAVYNFPNQLLVGLFGATGIGKTSLINSILYAAKGEIERNQWIAVAPADFEGGHTVRRKRVSITPHLTIADNRGIGAEDLGNNALDQIIAQLEGRCPFIQEVTWAKGIQKWKEEKGDTKDRIYCTVIVVSALNPETIFDVIPRFVKRLHEWQGCFPLAVITNVDEADKKQLDGTRLVLNSVGIFHLYEVANLHEKKEVLEVKYQHTILKMLERCMIEGDEIFQYRHDVETSEKE